MVYQKARSGDPDYDDKQPPEFHAGQVVTAGDGVFITPQGGAVDVNGAHANLAEGSGSGDGRPRPGDMAEESSTVQIVATTPPVAAVEADKDTVAKLRTAQAATIKAGLDMANGVTEAAPEPTPARKSTPPAK
jgi:hypothetical protein